MTLDEMLAELRENILHDRSNLVEGNTDLLWSDATLVRYINEGVRRFARRTFCIRDGSTDEVTLITLTEDVTEYACHPSVLAVISAKFPDEQVDLKRAGRAAFDMYAHHATPYFDTALFTGLPPGKPLAYSTDEELAGDDYDSRSVVKLRVYPAPSADYEGEQIRLRVARLPITPLTTKTLNAVPEIPEDHHMTVLDWAAHLALRIQDRDGNDAKNSEWFRKQFEMKVAEAKQELLSKMFVPMQWGFGANGWSGW